MWHRVPRDAWNKLARKLRPPHDRPSARDLRRSLSLMRTTRRNDSRSHNTELERRK
nr:MAG TPA: hypothetical protein [Bacteriophage sp.]